MTLAERLATVEEIPEPWPHGILDDFLPAQEFEELLRSLPGFPRDYRTKKLPASVRELLTAPETEDAIRRRFGFEGGQVSLALTYRKRGLERHRDRDDKHWSGILYLAGSMGTELYTATGELGKTVEFRPNRLLCWAKCGEEHAVPANEGRYAIQWWFLK